MAHRRHAAAQLAPGSGRADEAQLTAAHPAREVELLVVPYDSGHRDTRMGAGPNHLLSGGLSERLSERGHGVRVTQITADERALPTEIATAFDLHRQLAGCVADARARGALPITLAGNCGSAVGTLAGMGVSNTGVLWFDAHGDFNTPETTVGGFLDGMALAIVTGRCWTKLAARVPNFSAITEEHVILVGGVDLDEDESLALAESDVVHLRPDAVSALATVVDALTNRVEQLYLHVDLDVLDASVGVANEYAGGPGLTLAELLDAIETAAARFPIGGAAITAFDPAYDHNRTIRRAGIAVVERIAELASAR